MCFVTYNAGFADMPKLARRPRHRRTEDAPRIETAAWVQAMPRRIDASVSRDRVFGVGTLNCVFRSSVSLSDSLYAYDDPNSQEGNLTPQSLANGAMEIAKA